MTSGKISDDNQLVNKDIAMRLIMNYTWSDPRSKIKVLKDSGGSKDEIQIREFFLHSFNPVNMLFNKKDQADQDIVKFIEHSETLMSVDYKIYDKIREIKRQVREERMSHKLQNILNPNLDESQPDLTKDGLINDFEDLLYDFDLQEDDYMHGEYNKCYYDDSDEESEEAEEKKSDDMWEDASDDVTSQDLVQRIQDEIKEESKQLGVQDNLVEETKKLFSKKKNKK